MPVVEPLLTAPRRTRTLFRRAHARATASSRMLPGFLVIGTQKGGTTSLHDHLCEHPQVLPPVRKEVHYFTCHSTRPESWYRSHFARPPEKGPPAITGEATPYYLFHPAAPARAHALLPEARLVALLRDPVDRAHSHHNHELALGFERLPFEAALAAEEERLAGVDELLASDPRAVSFEHQHFSYIARGRYADQLERWLERYPRERMLLLVSEEFFADPAAATVAVQRFLGLPERPPHDLSPRNARSPGRLEGARRRSLAAKFADDNERLSRLLGRDVPWD
jgi:hypothetical protein